MKILFFIGSLRSGGKERRLVELLSYLKKVGGYEILLVLAFQGVDYPKFFELGINYICLNKKANSKDFKVFFEIDKICKQFKPDIIHSWGSMQTFYMIPTAKLGHIPLINSQITDAPPILKINAFTKFVNYCNFRFSDIILANSYAGLKSYFLERNKKTRVIYNGMNPHRFNNLVDVNKIKGKYKIVTPYSVVMAGSFSALKDWKRFYEVARYVTSKSGNISFIGVGGVVDKILYDEMKSNESDRILFPGRTTEVENLVNACDIGVLFSTNGEGISNTILEYMAVGKPIIVDECGGTPEFVKEGVNGYFTTGRSIEDVGDMIIDLCANSQKREQIGKRGKKTIDDTFTIDKMGREFEKLYDGILQL